MVTWLDLRGGDEVLEGQIFGDGYMEKVWFGSVIQAFTTLVRFVVVSRTPQLTATFSQCVAFVYHPFSDEQTRRAA